MRASTTDRNQSTKLLWDWIWPSLFLLDVPFAVFFVVLPNPTFVKFLIATALFLIHLLIAYWVRYRQQLVYLWLLFIGMLFVNLTCFTSGFAFDACFRLRWPQDAAIASLFLIPLIAVALVTWQYYTPGMKEPLEADCRTGRFDLQRGTFSLLIPPTFYEFKTPLLRKATAILLPASGILIAISAASGVHSGEKILVGKDLWSGVLSMVLAILFVFAATCTYYTYTWIRRWEKSTGRTMWIKGFEPSARSS